MQPQLYLASRSPRRRELLRQIDLVFETVDVDVDETRFPGEMPIPYARRIAEEKARAGVGAVDAPLPVLGADTIVVLEGQVLGKPSSRQEAIEMLLALSSRSHKVVTAVALARASLMRSRVQVSRVTFGRIDEQTARAYWETREPADKAGAYGIQGRAAQFISHLEGSFSGVMGLPLFETAQLCHSFGISLWRTAK